MASRTISTTVRTSRTFTHSGRVVGSSTARRSFTTAPPAFLAAVTTSIGKTKGVEGPEISAYPPPKHLKVPSTLTGEQVCRSTLPQFNEYRSRLFLSVSMIASPMRLLCSSRLKITIGMSQDLTSEVLAHQLRKTDFLRISYAV